MIIKIIQKTKIVYHYHPSMSYTIDEATKTISVGSTNYKLTPKNVAYLLNTNGTTIAVMKGGN